MNKTNEKIIIFNNVEDVARAGSLRAMGTALFSIALVQTSLFCFATAELSAQEVARSSSAIEEVIVTAQRREQSLQDVGASITAFSSNELQKLQVAKPSDLATYIPNLDMTSQLGSQNVVVTIRGLGLNDFSANLSPSVGVYIDEVFLASPAMVGFSIFDLERVEVLKGPQGTLYGRNSTGGAINFVTHKPGDELEGNARVGYGNYNNFETEGAVTIPLADNTGLRVAGKYQNRDSYYTNVSTGELGGLENYAIRGSLASELSENLKATLMVQHGREDGTNQIPNNVGVLGPNCTARLDGIKDPVNCVDASGYADPTKDPFVGDIGNVPDPFVDTKTYSVSLNLDWALTDKVTLTSVSGYQYFKRSLANETDANPVQALSDVRNDRIEQFSQELRLSGVVGKLDWIVGGFYSRDTVDGRNDFDFRGSLGFRAYNIIDQTTESFAGFVDGRYSVTEQWVLAVGARLTDEKRAFIGETGFLNGPVVSSTDNSIDKLDLSGRVALEFKPDEDSLYYASISKGFHSGGFFGSLAFNPLQYQPFTDETVLAYEVGGKWSFADNRMQVNAAGFYYEYKDVQTTTAVDFGSALTNINGTTTVKGLDFDVTAYPVDGLLLRGAIGVLDSTLPAFRGTLLGPIPKGNSLPNAPKFTATGLARYEFPVSNAGHMAGLQLDFQYKGKTYREAQNLPAARAKDFTVLNARASIASPDDQWEFAIWAKNLTNERYPEFIVFIALTQSALQTMASPRTYGATVSYNF